jgi:hypothetical protein
MKKAVFFAILIIITSCKKDTIEHPDCELLKTGLAELNENIVKNEIEKLTADLHPHPDPEDVIGQMQNLRTLADRLGSYCSGLTISVLCYGCIYTFPAMSEILVEFEYEGTTKKVVIDIITSDKDILRYGGVHFQ